MSNPVLEKAYKYCESVTRRHAKSFYFAAKFLPAHKQRAVFAVYAFCRSVDDEVDGSEPGTEKQAATEVECWKQRLNVVYAGIEGRSGNELEALHTVPSAEISSQKSEPDIGRPSSELVFTAWRDLLKNYLIRKDLPMDLIKGVLTDTHKKRYDSFDELYTYCYRVASTVGLMTSEILGYSDPKALEHAEALGVAMQLTNILRDIKDDADMGRIYLPREDLERFSVTEEQILSGRINPEFTNLMEFQIKRAREYYRVGEKGIAYLEKDTRFTVLFASRIYSRILTEIEALDFDVFHERAHTSKGQKVLSMPRVWFDSRRL